jgi:hypothetical protein
MGTTSRHPNAILWDVAFGTCTDASTSATFPYVMYIYVCVLQMKNLVVNIQCVLQGFKTPFA